MSSPAIYTPTYSSLTDTDTVAEATRRMLDDRVSDLPVIDTSGKFVGMFKLDRLYQTLLPAAALIGYGVPDLGFVSDTLAELRDRMREIEHHPVRDFVVQPDHVVHPDTPPLELVRLLHEGVNNIPVVDRDTGRLVGMASGRDLLLALRAEGD